MKSSSSGAVVPYVCELTRRRYRKPPPPIRGPEDVASLPAVKRLRTAKREHFLVLLLNARHEVEAIETVSIGSLNASIVHPRDLIRPAVLHSAAAIVCVHNHPSGDAEPSEEDISITKRVVQVGELLGITVLDHIIVASRGLCSLRARQLL
jgi:DNA repair protein RadC